MMVKWIGYDSVGGIVGYTSENGKQGKVRYCRNSELINGTIYVGGLAGNISKNGVFEKCFTNGEVSGESFTGCIIGVYRWIDWRWWNKRLFLCG